MILPLCLAISTAVECLPSQVRAAMPDGAMIELKLQGANLEGTPLAWDAQEVHLLGRDGRLWKVAPTEATDFRKIAEGFRPYSPSEFRAELLRELGDGYEVGGTGHYLIALPKGQREKWAERFEDLYRSFVHFFSVRGMNLSTPAFSLVGIVCRNQGEFAQFATIGDMPPPNGVLGFYDMNTNRINLYDMGGHTDSDWQENAAVIIHEATHQLAFNTGVHNRYCRPPTWLAEGLATLFEAPGVYDSHHFTRPSDRVNRGRLRAFRQGVAPHHRPELLERIVASDDLFRISPGAAYAEAWAFTFFLEETVPSKYVAYLKRTAARPPFQEYSTTERIADFTAIFGTDWRMLEAQFLRFMAAVN
jgi:hypothetical protein